MGIDVYAKWEGMTQADNERQLTGYNVTVGEVGYLREAYHGGPYVTHVLMPEAFEPKKSMSSSSTMAKEDDNQNADDDDDDNDDDDNEVGVPIAAATLRARLPAAEAAFNERYDKIYPKDKYRKEAWESFVSFVELCQRLEAASGKPVRIYASY